MQTYSAGLRVGEVAALRYGDVVDGNLRVRPVIRVGQPPRDALLSSRMRRQLAIYANAFPARDPAQPLFYTRKRDGWSANTLTQHFFHLYRAAGLAGASSHSGRRTFVSTLAQRGVGVDTVRASAGPRRVTATRAMIASDNPIHEAIEHL